LTTVISPSVGHAPSFTNAGVGTSPGYDAVDRRRAYGSAFREGVLALLAWKVTENSPTGMSVVIDADVAGAHILGDSVVDQGVYYCPPHTANIVETVSAADVTNPRIDRVVLEIKDNAHDSSGLNTVQTRVLAGTPTSGATLQNQSGVAALPVSALWLADFLVPASATTVINANIRDYRTYGRRDANVGDLQATARATAPDGWRLCDGTALNRLQFADLFTAISTTYGVGDGSTTFNIPDLRGRIPVGVDGAAGRLATNDALGQAAGSETVPAASGAVANLAGNVSAGNAWGAVAQSNMQPYQIVNWMIFTGTVL
jgi:microcystin-dependent protein